MPRKLRVEYEVAIYHLMNRRDRREPILLDEADRESFLQTLGEELKQSDEQRAERLLGEMLGAAGWRNEDSKHWPKRDIRKARMAARMRSATVMNLKWMAKRLEMGHWRTAANALRACPRPLEKYTISHL